MSRDTNYQMKTIGLLEKISKSISSSGASGATEATAQAILAALSQVNDNLTNNTNVLLTSIRDSNVAQEALITSTNSLLTNIRTDLSNLEAQSVITNTQLIDANTELDNIEASLTDIEANSTSFYNDIRTTQAGIISLLAPLNSSINAVTGTLNATNGRLDALVTQTDQVEAQLTTINTTLANNQTATASQLEQLRLLLVEIDANTDAIESELINIIAEHDQTQVLLTALNAKDFATETTLQSILTAITQTNTILTNNTNLLLSNILDSNVAQEALITSTNNVLADILTELEDIDSSIESNGLTIADIRVDLSDIQALLSSIDLRDDSFYSTVQTALTDIQSLIVSADSARATESADLINRINLLNGYTLGVQDSLSDIETALNTNSVVNVAKLEEIRVLLNNLDANTDAIESELINIIGEHDQTQVILSAINSTLGNSNLNRQSEASFLQSLVITSNNNLADIEATLTGSERVTNVVEETVDGSTDGGVQSFSILFRGNNGTLDGTVVRNNFSFSFTPNKGEDTVSSIPFTIPTTGEQRVIISYVR